MRLRLEVLKKQYEQALAEKDIKKAVHIKLQIEDIEGERK